MVEEDKRKLEPIKYIWEQFKRDGSLNINNTQIEIIHQIHKNLFNTGFLKTCNSCISRGLEKVFTQYENGRPA